MRRQDKSRIIREANEKLEERYIKILLKEDILNKTKGLLNESRYSEYLENTLFKKLENEKGVGRGSDEGQELVKNVLNPFEVEMNKFRKFITKRYNNPDKNEVKRNLKGEIERIVNGGKQLGIEEDVTMNAIVGQMYAEFFDRGSNSFTRLYQTNHVRFMLEAVKEVLEELQFNDKTFGIISRIDRYLKS